MDPYSGPGSTKTYIRMFFQPDYYRAIKTRVLTEMQPGPAM
jgi:hypothetical protein